MRACYSTPRRPKSDHGTSLSALRRARTKRRDMGLQVERLEVRLNMSTLVVGNSPGTKPIIQIYHYDGADLSRIDTFLPYSANFRGGVNVAQGDVNADGHDDIITAPATGKGEVKVFDGNSLKLIRSFSPFGKGFRGGVNVAFGSFGSPTGFIVTGKAHGGSQVKVFDAATGQQTLKLQAYGAATRGVQVAVANNTEDTHDEIITTPGPGGIPFIKGFDVATGQELYRVLAYNRRFRGGLELTTGDFDGNRVVELVTAPSGRSRPQISVWGHSDGLTLINRFDAFSANYRGGVIIGALQNVDNEPDLIAVGAARASHTLTQATGREIKYYDVSGNKVDEQAVENLGSSRFNVAPAVESFTKPYDGPKNIHGTDYSPTWPFWSSIKPTGQAGTDASNSVLFKKNDPSTWFPNVFAGQKLYVFQNSDPGNGKFYDIVSNTDSQLTISGTFDPVPDVNNFGYNLALDDITDSDFANSAFTDLWNTPRYKATDGSTLSDIQIHQSNGFNTVRLYDWDMQRGSSQGSVDQHIAFLDALSAAGLQAIVPVSNFFLGDKDVWNGYVPDYDYSNGPGVPQTLKDDLNFFVQSITKNGSIHPAVQSISVGNEIDGSAGGTSAASMTLTVQRAMWWVVNLQKALNQSRTDANRLRFSIPVTNADQSISSASKSSWFEVFRDGADPSSNKNQQKLIPFREQTNGQSFTQKIKGLKDVLGSDGQSIYADFFYNSYQPYQRDDLLLELMQQYANPKSTGPWTQQWPGDKFEVPLFFSELGWSISEAGSEDAFFDAVSEHIVLVAENYLRSPQNQDNTFMGYAFFEFSQEPNKQNLTGPPSGEQTRGIFKYYPTTDQDINHFRDTSHLITTATTNPTWFHFNGYQSTPMNYPVYELFSVWSSTKQKRLVDVLKNIMTTGAL